MNRASYDAIAEQWDAARSAFILREREYLDALIDGGSGLMVLDLGCGTGRPMAEALLEGGHRVVGIDQAEALLRIAAARNPGGHWILGRIEDCAWRGEYDAVVLWDSLFHIERTYHPTILGKVAASLRPGGRVMLTVGGSSHPAFTDTMFGREFFYDSLPPEEVIGVLTGLGLVPVLHEFMNRPTGGRDRGRYAIVARKADPARPGATNPTPPRR